ncbi:hypothetical protein [Streptosporangium carneum]|uniref:Uncharacterized protein n=1 Tax=Streptosporangium carneum TaxID=47481 RepID=A0A9W6MH08_9ACTN|nr:hypothetical protein [Streptosporangium carneum]GLK13498.1 hypothetical protein GCM10017600_69090 [Streptosporangium carneum]
MAEIDWSKHPSECTEAERWNRFYSVLAMGLVEAWREGRLVDGQAADTPAAA